MKKRYINYNKETKISKNSQRIMKKELINLNK